MNKTNTPQIRFKGFTEAWEQRKLSELGKVLTGNTPPTSERENWAKDENDYVWITPTDINALKMSGSERHLTAVGWGKARFVPSNSVLITSIASIGKNAINTVPAAFNQQINAIVPIGNSAYFILTAMENEKARFAGLAGKTATAIINKTEFEKFSFFIPKLQEQERISGFFENLDNLITLHQRKCEMLQKTKKALLEKIFPKNGSAFPEVRFKGFTEAWEQQKVDSVFDPIPNNTLSRADLNYIDGKVRNIHYGDILVKFGAVIESRTDEIPFITSGEVADYKNQLLRDGDVIFADTAEDETVGKAAEITGIGDGFVVSGLHTMVCRPNMKMAPYYLGYYLNSPSYHRQLLPLMQGIKVLSISRTNLAKTAVSYPTSEQEQAKIGAFFFKLDHLITLHQRELEKLQKLKSACLQKMFV